ncbi:formin-like protein 5 isoform X2 [Silene latifolia]|uniref:formin-like protein 5 isoform X2 n=1 Tax=Silene latifolia TaxID=37657 RepID=UPI003D76DBCA
MMQIKYVGVWFVFVVVFCGGLGRSLDDKEVINGVISGFNLVSAAQQSDKTLVEVLEKNCRLELLLLKRIYEDLGFTIPETSSSLSGKSIHGQALTEEDVQKALSFLDPQIKQSIYKCLRDNYVINPVSGEEVGWLQKHLRFVMPKPNPTANSRRQLAEAPSPAPAPARASSPRPSGSKKSGLKRKAPAPVDTFVIPIPVPRDSPSLDKDVADSGSDTTGDHHNNNQTTIIIVVAVTAVGTFVFATILFLCCRKAFGEGSDSPSKTWVLGNADDKEKISNQFYSNNSPGTIGGVSSEGAAMEFSTGVNASSSALKPPPGRTGIGGPSPGFSPLKPPPGKEGTFLHVPMKPSSGMGAPPPPPPPPPPKLPAAPPLPPPKKAGPPPPPPPGGKPGGPRAPPPPKGGAPPRPPPVSVKAGSSAADDNGSKTKLKPFFWDKVMANPDHSMVWDQIKSGSFQFNEEMIESLFGYAAVENKSEKKKDTGDVQQGPQFIQLIDHKKAQNLSILLRALNVTTEEVRDALLEGSVLPSELLETLLKMAPTAEEELKLRLFTGETSQLGPAERFLKVMVEIPFAFKRIEALLFMGTLHEESTTVKDNLATLEAACKELRSCRLFLKLLEAVLKTGNRMNDGTNRGGAQAFKLDTLLKLADVKGTDGKTTLLHFVVQEIIRSEGVRASRAGRESKSMSSIVSEDLLEDVVDDSEEHYRSLGLEVVSGVGAQLQNVRKAASLDSDSVARTIAKLGSGLLKAKNFLNKEIEDMDEQDGFANSLKSFVDHAEADVMKLLEEEKRIMALVKNTVDYFHGNTGKEEGLRLFIIVRDFLIILEKVCREVKARPKWPSKAPKREPPARQTSTETPRTPFSPDFRNRLFPAIAERRMEGSSSDDD